MNDRFCAVMVGALLALGASAPASGEFVPGNIYISAHPSEPGGPNDRIYEFNPATGASREFVVLPDEFTPGLTGLVFTPDYSALRGSVFLASMIVEIDGNAKASVALDSSDGILGPTGSNNVAYDRAGNFYVVNHGAGNIMRFPADGGPGAPFASGVSVGPIATTPENSVYYAVRGDEEIKLFTAPGEGRLFDRLPDGNFILSLATNTAGDLFVLSSDNLYRYLGGDPDSRELFATGVPGTAITLSPDERFVYVARLFEVLAIDTATGQVNSLGSMPFVDNIVPGRGIAVYVPEPSSSKLLLLLAVTGRAFARR